MTGCNLVLFIHLINHRITYQKQTITGMTTVITPEHVSKGGSCRPSSFTCLTVWADRYGGVNFQMRMNARGLDRSRFICWDNNNNIIANLLAECSPENIVNTMSVSSFFTQGTILVISSFVDKVDVMNFPGHLQVSDTAQPFVSVDTQIECDYVSERFTEERFLTAKSWLVGEDFAMTDTENFEHWKSIVTGSEAGYNLLEIIEEHVPLSDKQSMLDFLTSHPKFPPEYSNTRDAKTYLTEFAEIMGKKDTTTIREVRSFILFWVARAIRVSVTIVDGLHRNSCFKNALCGTLPTSTKPDNELRNQVENYSDNPSHLTGKVTHSDKQYEFHPVMAPVSVFVPDAINATTKDYFHMISLAVQHGGEAAVQHGHLDLLLLCLERLHHGAMSIPHVLTLMSAQSATSGFLSLLESSSDPLSTTKKNGQNGCDFNWTKEQTIRNYFEPLFEQESELEDFLVKFVRLCEKCAKPLHWDVLVDPYLYHWSKYLLGKIKQVLVDIDKNAATCHLTANFHEDHIGKLDEIPDFKWNNLFTKNQDKSKAKSSKLTHVNVVKSMLSIVDEEDETNNRDWVTFPLLFDKCLLHSIISTKSVNLAFSNKCYSNSLDNCKGWNSLAIHIINLLMWSFMSKESLASIRSLSTAKNSSVTQVTTATKQHEQTYLLAVIQGTLSMAFHNTDIWAVLFRQMGGLTKLKLANLPQTARQFFLLNTSLHNVAAKYAEIGLAPQPPPGFRTLTLANLQNSTRPLGNVSMSDISFLNFPKEKKETDYPGDTISTLAILFSFFTFSTTRHIIDGIPPPKKGQIVQELSALVKTCLDSFVHFYKDTHPTQMATVVSNVTGLLGGTESSVQEAQGLLRELGGITSGGFESMSPIVRSITSVCDSVIVPFQCLHITALYENLRQSGNEQANIILKELWGHFIKAVIKHKNTKFEITERNRNKRITTDNAKGTSKKRKTVSPLSAVPNTAETPGKFFFVLVI